MLKILFVLIFLFSAYAAAENLLLLRVRREKFGSGIRIAQISDLHKRRFGKDNERLCSRVRAEKPDVIFITGDIVSRTVTSLERTKSLLNQLCEIAPVYMIFGNHEQSISEEMASQLPDVITDCGVTLLRNTSTELNIRGRKVTVYGLEQKYTTYIKNDSYRDLDDFTLADMRSLIGDRPDGEVLLLAHNPLFGEVYAQWGAEYTFSGHVHGGAVRLFGVGMLSPERRLLPKYTKGVYTINGMKLLVSGGLGKLRLFNPSEIVIYYI